MKVKPTVVSITMAKPTVVSITMACPHSNGLHHVHLLYATMCTYRATKYWRHKNKMKNGWMHTYFSDAWDGEIQWDLHG